MRKLLPTTLLGVAGLTAFGLVAMSSPTLASASDEAAKREDDAPSLVLVADDDDDDTNDDGDDDDTDGPSYTDQSRETNDNTNSRVTGVSRDRDHSRGDKTRDWTRDGGDRTRDWSQNKTNDRSRNDTRG